MKDRAFDGSVCCLVFLCFGVAVLAGHGCKQEAEQPVPRFENSDLSRFTIKRETTPSSYPNLYLIHDSVTGQDMLFVDAGTSGAGFMLGQTNK